MAKTEYGVLENVVIAYAKVAEPSKKYQSEDLEYSIDCIVDKATAKAFSKQFTKQKAKELDVEEFVEKYKIEAPFDGDEVYVIKLRKPASKDGEIYDDKYRPKVLLDTADGERTDITTSRLISNGSVGKVSYRITSNDFGTFAQLNNILLDEDGFVEYVSTGGAGSEFGDGKSVTKAEAPRKEATQARASKEAAKEEVEDAPVKPAKKVAVPANKPAKVAPKKETVKEEIADSNLDDDAPF